MRRVFILALLVALSLCRARQRADADGHDPGESGRRTGRRAAGRHDHPDGPDRRSDAGDRRAGHVPVHRALAGKLRRQGRVGGIQDKGTAEPGPRHQQDDRRAGVHGRQRGLGDGGCRGQRGHDRHAVDGNRHQPVAGPPVQHAARLRQHGNVDHGLLAGHQQRRGVRVGGRLRQRAHARRRGHTRPGPGRGVDVLQLQHRRRGPGRRPRSARGVRRLHRRGGQLDHQVGRQPLLLPDRREVHERRASRATTRARSRSRRTSCCRTRRATPSCSTTPCSWAAR